MSGVYVGNRQTGIKRLSNGRFRARYFAGYNSAGKRVYPARTFDTQSAALKWRSEGVRGRIVVKETSRTITQIYSQGTVYTAPFSIPPNLKSIRQELLEIHLPLARVCCVYFLLSAADEVLYVGQTVDLHQRIKAHQQAGVQFCRALFVPVQAPDLNATEAHFIRTLNPPLNKAPARAFSHEPIALVSELVRPSL